MKILGLLVWVSISAVVGGVEQYGGHTYCLTSQRGNYATLNAEAIARGGEYIQIII